jgi:hypothetical protein
MPDPSILFKALLLLLPQGWFSLRSLGAVGKADPPTSRPGGPLLELVKFCHHALCSLRCSMLKFGGAYAPEQLKGEGE